MGKLTITGEVVQDYLTRYPNTATKTLASMLYRDNKEMFTDLEHARSAVRYYRGAMGAKKRGEVSTKEYFRVTDKFNPFNLPEPDRSREVLPYNLPKDIHNALIISDLHMPYHDLEPLTVAFEYGLKHKIDALIINGDGLDFFAVSRFATDPRKRDLGRELETGKAFIAETDKIFPQKKVKKIWKDGNHEERWQKYLWVKAPELVGAEIFELPQILELEKYGYSHVDSRAEIYAGNNFTIVHGHEFSDSIYSPVNPARGLYLRYEHNAICGHYHRPSHHSQKTGRGQIRATWSLGCTCLLRPEYATQNKWIHGFAVLTRESEHDFHLRNFKVIDGQMYES